LSYGSLPVPIYSWKINEFSCANLLGVLAALTGEPTTYNELASSSCAAYTVIFARGTTEPGNVGILVGPPFFDALDEKVGAGNVVVQGVNNYKADVQGYVAGGDAGGSADM
jgi:cutinase